MRLFIAIPIEDRIQKLFEKNIDKAQSELDYNLKWVSGKNLHLTLKFLGETEEERIEDIKTAVSNTCSNYEQFNIYYDHYGAFPSTDYPKVLFFGLKNNKNTLIKLQKELENRLAKSGFEKEDRDYTPHLTFARTRKSTDINKLKYDFNNFVENNKIRILQKVNSISLIESKLHKSGPVYKEIFSINLN